MKHFDIKQNDKFAIVAVSANGVDKSLPQSIYLYENAWCLTSLPVVLTERWEKWIGGINAEAISKASLFFVVKKPSQTPSVLGQEDEDNKTEVGRLYFGLLLSGFTHYSHQSAILTGAWWDSQPEIRTFSEYPSICTVPGSPRQKIDEVRINTVRELAQAHKTLTAQNKHERFYRSLQAFCDGLESRRAWDRLHQFCRCIEGLLLPVAGNTKSQFKSRTELFIGPTHHHLMDQIYDIRSDVEHLHEPMGLLHGKDEREKRTTLIRHSLQVEELSRYCLRRIFEKTTLWPHFETDTDIAQFWRLDGKIRSQKWGSILDLQHFSDQLNFNHLQDHHLGL